MSQLFARILKQAFTTFDQSNGASFQKNFAVLKQLVDQLTPCDINLNMQLVTDEAFSRVGKAPCTYVSIYENNHFEFSVFILRSGFTMPLHDHPVMYGILKTMSGSVRLQSFTKTVVQETASLEPDPIYDEYARRINVIANSPRLLTNREESTVLTPTEGNYHEIIAVDGVAAFFDILSPPYDTDIPKYGPRTCSYFRKVSKNDETNEVTLERVPPPRGFYCDRADYDPPDFFSV